MKKICLIIALIGFIGALITVIAALSDPKAADIVSVLPLSMLFNSLFVIGTLGFIYKK